jgi:hypothetical protein
LLTLNQIHAQIVALANAHYQIAEVGMGTIAELQGKPDRNYPLLWLSNEGGSVEGNYKVDNIRLTMFGRVIVGEEGQDDDASEIEVLSDMQLILLDFLNYFHQQHGQEYVTDKAATLEHFTERTNDRTAGYSCVLELKQFYDWNKCQIPQSGATIPPSIDGLTLYDFCDASVIDRLTAEQVACLEAEFGQCADVTEQINGVTIGTSASGSTNNQVITDTATNPVGTGANPSVIADTSITSSLGNFTDTALAESTYTIANVSWTNSDGSPESTEYGQAIVCDVATPVPSLAVAVSSATPNFNDTITVTATPTNITPSAYRFYAQGANDTIFIGTSATNSISWKVVAPHGSMSIYAEATDGAGLTAYTDSPQAITVTGALFDRFTAATMGFSLEQRGYRFFGPVVKIRRSSDNATANFGFLNGSLDTVSILAFCGVGNGFVVQWFGQSAERNVAYQQTAASQPKIVSAGAMVTASNGKPAIDFDGVNDFMNILNTSSFVTGFFSYQNDAIATNLVQEIVACGATFTSQVYAAGTAVTGAGVTVGATIISSTVKDTNRHYMSIMTASNDGVYIDGTDITLGVLDTFTALVQIGSRGGAFFMDGKIQDIIGYPDDQFANRAAIEAYLT